MEVLIALLGALGLGTGSAWFVIRNLYYICQPSEVLIFAGTSTRLPDGNTVGYRLVKGGSSLQIPLLERTFRMDLTNMIIDLKVVGAYSKGGIPLTVTGVANIKIAGTEPTIHNAIERLLGKSRAQIEKLAKETLEGNLRGVLASLTPEEANGDQIAFARSLLEEAEEDLQQLGLMLDSLQIQTISDDVGYLDSIGRKQQAELIRDARIAEAQAKAESIVKASANECETALRELLRDEEIAKIEATKGVRDALTKRAALVTEVESIAAAQIAEVEAEIKVETARIVETEQRLQADVLAPAEAKCHRAMAEAKGNAAKIIENGEAQALGLQRLGEVWRSAGTDAREVFLYQKIGVLMQMMAAGVPKIAVSDVTVIDAKNGTQATKLAAFLEQFNQATGVDLKRIVGQVESGK
ncbi:flotillin family protein [Leptothermofonsia sichuanensis E412]|uniref:flotillin family protein n=1 Tax=Leptothermofonsia sichuanensis TaxID=2917832 RepID=UPI001CA780C0|nr:SPFH domain-containing protein [Leptothermofonsia sichuanensis]QZZ20382.1 flotillin family protein [Leptothermofonsia sichuanensis E412]